MIIIKIIFGALLLFVAWTYIFHKKLAFQLNAWMREYVFNDQIVLFSGRRIAILLLILGGVALFSGLEGIIDVQPVKPNIAATMIEEARKDSKNGRYSAVVRRCRELIRSTPNSVEAWELLVDAYSRLGEKQLAQEAASVLLRLSPDHPIGQSFFQTEKQRVDRERE